MAGFITLRITCRLPVKLQLGDVQWTIGMSYDAKGRHAAIFASSSGKDGDFLKGRRGYVESELRNGFAVPVGTIRHRLACALVDRGLAEVMPR
jgi:hypothetical protein